MEADAAALALKTEAALKQLAGGKPAGEAPKLPEIAAAIDKKLDEALAIAQKGLAPGGGGGGAKPSDPLGGVKLDQLHGVLGLQEQVMRLEREHAAQMNALEWQRR